MTVENFHRHLDDCHRCAQRPFDLCPEGRKLVWAAAEGLGPQAQEAVKRWDRLTSEEHAAVAVLRNRIEREADGAMFDETILQLVERLLKEISK